MLLHNWVEFFDNPPQSYDPNPWVRSPSSYIPTAIRFLIKLDAKGKYQGLITTTSGNKRDRGRIYTAPHVLVTSGPEPKLLVGNCEYVLGRPRDPKKDSKKVLKRHKLFIAEVEKCAQETGNQQVKTVLNFLISEVPKNLVLPDDFESEDLFTFMVEESILIDQREIQEHWLRTQKESYEEERVSGQCIVCGNDCIPGKVHPIQMKGIPGGQTSGMAIVSANKEKKAFKSYGLEASLLSPTCWDCAERYAKAYYILQESEDSHLVVGPLVYLFWTREPVGFNIVTLCSQPKAEEVKALIASARSGKPRTGLDPQAFYATALTASGGRVVVRDWMETTVGQVKDHLARWFALQEIVNWDGSDPRPFSLKQLASILIPGKGDAQRDLPPNTPRILLKAALQGGPLPYWLLFQAVKRNRAEQKRPDNPRDFGLWRWRWSARNALIKMVLLSHETLWKEEIMVRLDETNTQPAYLCGRLLALLERVQMLAVSPKATLIDRFYGTASTAPASVFARLLKGAQPHLGKLRKERFGAYSALQSRLEEVMTNLSGFPKVLSLEEQGWFSLGYYHQRAWDRAQAKARKEEQVPGEEAVVEETPTDEKE
jgi:CRISPR-associated protein Csd1